MDSFAEVIERRGATTTDRETLLAAVTEQYKRYGVKLPKGTKRLLQPDTYTVVTAHQASLFLGPLYYVYKVLSTVALAATAP